MKKTKSKQASNQIRSKQMMFWLDLAKPVHNHVWDIASDLKSRRRYNPSVINGLRLIADLDAGNVDVLLELYPLIGQLLEGKKSGSGDESGGMGKVIELLQRMQTTSGLPNNSNIPYASQGIPAWVALTPGGMPAPIDEPKIETKKDTAKPRGAWNALIASAALSGSYQHLHPDILAYGIESGKIPKSAGTKKIKAKPQPKGDGNSKPMDVPQFAAPSFDDEDDIPVSRLNA